VSSQSNDRGRTFERIVHGCLNLSLVDGIPPNNILNKAILDEALRLFPDFSRTKLDDVLEKNYCDSAKKLAGFLVAAIAGRNKVVKIEHYEDSRSASELDPSDLGLVFSNKSVLGISCKANHEASSHDRVSANQNSNTVVNWLDGSWVNANESAINDFKMNIEKLFRSFEKKAVVRPGGNWRDLDKETKYQLYTDIAREVCSFLRGALSDRRNSTKLLRRIFGSRPYFKVKTDPKKNKVTIQPVLINYRSAQNWIPLNPAACQIALRGVSIANMSAPLSPNTVKESKHKFERLVVSSSFSGHNWEWRGRLHNAKTEYERSLKFDFEICPDNVMEKIFGKSLIV